MDKRKCRYRLQALVLLYFPKVPFIQRCDTMDALHNFKNLLLSLVLGLASFVIGQSTYYIMAQHIDGDITVTGQYVQPMSFDRIIFGYLYPVSQGTFHVMQNRYLMYELASKSNIMLAFKLTMNRKSCNMTFPNGKRQFTGSSNAALALKGNADQTSLNPFCACFRKLIPTLWFTMGQLTNH